MATVRIGGKDYDLPPLTFKTIKQVWPLVQKMDEADFLNSTDPKEAMAAMDVVIQIFAHALEKTHPDMTAEEIESVLLGSEMSGLAPAMTDLLVDSGLANRVEGDAKTGGGSGGAAPKGKTHRRSKVTGTP
jgi:hypothetical protein